jgi:hypothetical protein
MNDLEFAWKEDGFAAKDCVSGLVIGSSHVWVGSFFSTSFSLCWMCAKLEPDRQSSTRHASGLKSGASHFAARLPGRRRTKQVVRTRDASARAALKEMKPRGGCLDARFNLQPANCQADSSRTVNDEKGDIWNWRLTTRNHALVTETKHCERASKQSRRSQERKPDGSRSLFQIA